MKHLRLPTAAALLFALSTEGAFAGGYNLPDPPNTVTFDKVQLRVVPAPRGKVPASCDPKYRTEMEGSFRRVWEQCQAIGKDEPSDCQRALFDRCTRLAHELQAMESGVCVEMLGERDALDRIRNPDTQRNAQESSADLNRRAAAATRKVAEILGRHARGLAAHRAGGDQALRAAACSASTAARDYRTTEGRLLAEVKGTEKFVATEVAARQAAAAELDKSAAKAAANAGDLKSLAAAGQLPVTTRTSIETVTVGPAASTATVVSTSSGTTSYLPPKRSAVPPVSYTAGSDEKKIDWVPILAVGIPAAAILGGIIYAKNRGGNDGGDQPEPGPGPEPGPSPGAGPSPGDGERQPPPEEPAPNPPTQDTTSPVPGGEDLRSLQMTLDSSFTDREKAVIAHAVKMVPACHRGKLRQLRISSANLGGRGSRTGGCVAGVYRLGGYEVKLDPRCAGIQVGITLHELFHVVGNRNNNALHRAYLTQVFQPHPRCPVSRYGATHWMEDFAEAGRLQYFPRGGQKNAQACVDRKLEGLHKMLSSCPQ